MSNKKKNSFTCSLSLFLDVLFFPFIFFKFFFLSQMVWLSEKVLAAVCRTAGLYFLAGLHVSLRPSLVSGNVMTLTPTPIPYGQSCTCR